MEAAAKRRQRENERFARLAWQTAAYTRAKKMPSLESVLEAQKPRSRQTWQQQAAVFANW